MREPLYRALTMAALLLLLAVSSGPVQASASATVEGQLHKRQGPPVCGALVRLIPAAAARALSTRTDARGHFRFPSVALGDYQLRVDQQGFASLRQPLRLLSGTTVQLSLELTIAAGLPTVLVTGAPVSGQGLSATPSTLIDQRMIQQTPGADRTNSLAMITDFVPGAYLVHDQLHLRGGHQTAWQIDGVEIPNTSIAGNVGPQIDPKDIADLEVERGSYQADQGDRTYGVFNVVPRSGWDSHRQTELVASGGSYGQTNDYASLADHAGNLAWYVSADGDRSDLGLMTPTPQILHDAEDGYGGFTNVDYDAGDAGQLRLIGAVRHDDYQIPNAPGQIADDVQRESDAFAVLSLEHHADQRVVWTSSLLYHDNEADLDASPGDVPVSSTYRHASAYIGGQESLRANLGASSVQAGLYGFHQQDRQYFQLLFNDGSGVPIAQTLSPQGGLLAAWIEESLRATRHLQLQAGVRYTRFQGLIAENATDPRLAFTWRLPLGWVLRGFYGDFYQAPPLETLSGPLLGYVNRSNLAVLPLHGEQDREWQVGVNIPVAGWSIDTDHFRTRASNYFDHNPVGDSSIFLPVTIQGALIEATELAVRSPRLWNRLQLHVAYSNQTADGIGAVSGGLTDFSPPAGAFALDHDQRNTFDGGADLQLPASFFLSVTLYYGSGFSNGEAGPSHLPSHSEVDLQVGKQFTARLQLSLTVLNAANEHLLIDNSLTFDGQHYNAPRQIYAEARYLFGH